MEARESEALSFSDVMRLRYEGRKARLHQNGQSLKREMLALVELIDAGEWERFDVKRGELVNLNGKVDVLTKRIKREIDTRSDVLYYAKLSLGGYKHDVD